jgi:hypothetical protein
MDDIRLTRNLMDQGYNWVDLRRLQRDGDLVRVRRGAYALGDKTGEFVEERHRRLILATAPQVQDGAIFSHGSAAVLHGLPVWSGAVARVHVTRNRRGKGIKRSVVHVHGAPLQPSEIVLIDNLPVTSLARTVLSTGNFRRGWSTRCPCGLRLERAQDGWRVRREDQIRAAAEAGAAYRGRDLRGEVARGRGT